MKSYLSKMSKRVFKVARDYPGTIAMSGMMSVGKVMSTVAAPLLFLKGLSDMGVDNDASFEAIAPWVAGYVALWTLSEVLFNLQEKVLHPAAMQLAYNLTHEVMETFYCLPMEARASNTNAPAVQHFGAAYEYLGNAFIKNIFGRILPSLFEIVIISGVVLYENQIVGLFLLSVAITYAGATIVCTKRISKSQSQYIGSLYERFDFIISQLDQYENAHYYDNVRTELDRSDTAMRQLGRDSSQAASVRSLASVVLSSVAGVGVAGTLTYSTYLFTSGVMSSNKLIILMLYLLQFGNSLKIYSESASSVVTNYQNFKYLLDYVDQTQHDSEVLKAVPIISKEAAEVVFQNVSFVYSGMKHGLEKMSFKIQPKSVTAIVGRSGAGKSTLTRLLMAFYFPTKGKITIAGIDLMDIDPTALRRNFAVVPQTPAIFSGNIFENIRYGNLSASDEEVLEAARKAGLGDLIRRNALTASSGSGGRKISGGQKQRISIARAYLRPRAAFLVLDEPTAALDPKTEEEVLVQLNELILSRGNTVIIITHDLDTLKKHINVDQVINLDLFSVYEESTDTDYKHSRLERKLTSDNEKYSKDDPHYFKKPDNDGEGVRLLGDSKKWSLNYGTTSDN